MVKIAIVGFGVVGSGVAEVLSQNSTLIKGRADRLIELKYILTRSPLDHPASIHDFSIIENDPEVSIVVETIGGTEVALDYTTRALKAGKSVVSSNKELVATHGYELLQLAREHGVNYLFEASVGGGIPILRPLTSCLAANEISEVTGILNGTTNYILTSMIKSGLPFETALASAQSLGYAESDPTADVEGHDACRKVCILAALAFGRHVYPDQVTTQGITNITLADVDYAQFASYKIKLLGRAIRRDDGKLLAFVAPHLVSCDNPLAGVEDVFNAITIRGNAIGDAMFYGRGAGKLPTASAVVADVIDLAKNITTDRRNAWASGDPTLVVPNDDLSARFYVRATGTQAEAKSCVPDLTPLSRSGAPADEIAFLTPAMTQTQLTQALAPLAVQSTLRLLD